MEPSSGRLDGWKAIAAHLGRDERTAQRWRHRGLPVHAVPGGKKGTVFAYVHELDEWITQAGPSVHDEPHEPAPHDEPPEPPPHDGTPFDEYDQTPPTPDDRPASRRAGAARYLSLTGLLAVAVGAGLALVPDQRPRTADLIVRAEVTPGGLVAWRADGQPAFSVAGSQLVPDDFPAAMTPLLEARQVPIVTDVDGDDGMAEVVVVLGFHDNSPRLSEEVRVYDADGALRWRHQIAQTLRFGGRDFDGPWRVSDQLVTREPDGHARLWLTVIHDVWWPSFVVSLDATGAARLHLVHSGHLYALDQVETPDGERLVLTGVNNEYKSAVMVALDPRAPTALSPQSRAEFACERCAGDAPARYLLLPQSEVNLIEGRAYNLGTMVAATGTMSRVSVDEMPDPHLLSHYTLSPRLEPQSVEMSDLYWAHHRQLEVRGLIAHSAEECPERPGRTVRSWTGEGWQEIWVPSEMPQP